MHNPADFQAHRQHQNEMAREIEDDRLGRQGRSAGPKKNLLAGLIRGLGCRASGAPQAAG
jgi:hypothetical protein